MSEKHSELGGRAESGTSNWTTKTKQATEELRARLESSDTNQHRHDRQEGVIQVTDAAENCQFEAAIEGTVCEKTELLYSRLSEEVAAHKDKRRRMIKDLARAVAKGS